MINLERRKYKKGQVIIVDFGKNKGSVQSGIRPAIVLVDNYISITVIPLTSKIKKNIPTHCDLLKTNYSFLREDSTVLGEQILTVSKKNIIALKGDISSEDMVNIDSIVKISVNADTIVEGTDIKRGDFVSVKFGKTTKFAIVVQNDIGNKFSSTTIITPIENLNRFNKNKYFFSKKKYGFLNENKYLNEDILTISKEQIINIHHKVNKKDMSNIDDIISTKLSINKKEIA